MRNSQHIYTTGFGQSPASRQRGVTLIDAMIGLVIFSVGLLALASLQTISKHSNFEAIQRSYAAEMAYDLFERIRMNSSNATIRAEYVNAYKTINSEITATDCTTTQCDNQQLASWDLENWRQSLIGSSEQKGATNVGGLINPVACLETTAVADPPGGVEATLTIVWQGQTALPDTHAANTCGAGNYDGTPGDNAYRRILVMTTYINE